jgi:hypothetical protein
MKATVRITVEVRHGGKIHTTTNAEAKEARFSELLMMYAAAINAGMTAGLRLIEEEAGGDKVEMDALFERFYNALNIVALTDCDEQKEILVHNPKST